MPHKKFKRVTPMDVENLLEKCSGYHTSFVVCMAREINLLIETSLVPLKPKPPPKITISSMESSEPECKE